MLFHLLHVISFVGFAILTNGVNAKNTNTEHTIFAEGSSGTVLNNTSFIAKESTKDGNLAQKKVASAALPIIKAESSKSLDVEDSNISILKEAANQISSSKGRKNPSFVSDTSIHSTESTKVVKPDTKSTIGHNITAEKAPIISTKNDIKLLTNKTVLETKAASPKSITVSTKSTTVSPKSTTATSKDPPQDTSVKNVAKVPKKPLVTVPSDEDFMKRVQSLASKPVVLDVSESKPSSKTVVDNQIHSPNDMAKSNDKEATTYTYFTRANAHPGIIVPVVITIVVVPVFALLGFMALKRGREAWKNRHYSRMDFLLDGMYND